MGRKIVKKEFLINVYAFPSACWKCKTQITCLWVEDGNFEIVAGKPYAKNIKKVFSRVWGEVYGNICPNCGAYQGNFYVFENYAEAYYNGLAKQIAQEKVEGEEEVYFCDICGKELERHDVHVHHISYNPPETIELCRSCHIKIHKRKGFLDYLQNE